MRVELLFRKGRPSHPGALAGLRAAGLPDIDDVCGALRAALQEPAP